MWIFLNREKPIVKEKRYTPREVEEMLLKMATLIGQSGVIRSTKIEIAPQYSVQGGAVEVFIRNNGYVSKVRIDVPRG